MSRKLPVFFVVCIAAFATFFAAGPSLRSNSPASSVRSAVQGTNLGVTRARLLSSYGKLPLTFEQNLGQTDSRVRFLARGGGYALFLTGQEAVLRLDAPIARDTRITKTPAPGPADASPRAQSSSAVVRLALAGSNPHSLVEGLDLQPGRSNYFIGNDPSKWRRGVPHYARVKYGSIYPGIDLIYYGGSQGHLESDFTLAPGADPSEIALRIEGADKLKFDSEAGLLLSTKSGDVVLHRPVAYQEAAGLRHEIAANYIERGPGVVGIQLGPYDSTRPLVIDPVLVYSTYLGGSGNDHGFAISANSSGNAYVTGTTGSTDFPGTSGGFSAAASAFITELNPAGTALVFSTYLGGPGTTGNSGVGIALDTASPPNIYVAGTTDSTSFPVTPSAFQLSNNGTSTTAFMTKLDPTGSTLLYSTYIGGNATETCFAIAVDAGGNAYITGVTTSTNYPVTVQAIQSSNTSGSSVFVTRFDPTLSGTGSVVYSTLLGGSTSGHLETGKGIAVDSSGNAFVAGETNSPTFPVTPTAAQSSLKGTAGNSFLAEIDTTTTNHLVYSSFLGGTATAEGESALGIALDASFNAYITGSAATNDFPTTPGAFQRTITTNLPAYVARFDTTKSGASSLVYSTYLAGSGSQFARAIAVDSAGDAFVTGSTDSNNFPVTPGASQPASGGSADVFLTELNPGGSALLFSTYLGGIGVDSAFGIGIDSASPPSVYVTGFTGSATTFPVTAGAFQTTSKSIVIGGGNAFVSKFTPASAAAVFASPSAIDFGTVNLNSPSPSQAVTLVNNTTSALTGIAITLTGPNLADFSQTNTCGSTLAANSTCTANVVFTPSVSGAESATLDFAFTGASGSPQQVALTGSGSASAQPDFSLSVSPSPLSVTAGGPGNFTVTVTSINSFSAVVALSCTGMPTNSACNLLPAAVTPPSGSTQTSAGSITTHALIPPSLPSFPRLRPMGVLGILGLLLALFLARVAAQRGARKLSWGFALIGVLTLAGCSGVPGGGGGGGGSGSTPKGTSTITITGTSGALSHTATFSFTVN